MIKDSEPTKEQMEKWRSEFEKEFKIDEISLDYFKREGSYESISEDDKWEVYREARKKAQKDIDLVLNALQRESEENEELKQELQKTREQLEKAEKVIEFYGDPEHWILRIGRDAWKSSNPKKHGDSELIRGYNHFNTEWRGSVGVGGKLARQYFKDKDK